MVNSRQGPGFHPLTRLATLVLLGDDDDDVAYQIRRLVAEQCSFRLNGTAADLDGYLDHVRDLRARIKAGELRVVEEITDSGATLERVAGRYITRLRMHDGAIVRAEVHLIGVLDSDRRIAKLYDVAQLIGDEGDALLAG
jgi:hypothetical protein